MTVQVLFHEMNFDGKMMKSSFFIDVSSCGLVRNHAHPTQIHTKKFAYQISTRNTKDLVYSYSFFFV